MCPQTTMNFHTHFRITKVDSDVNIVAACKFSKYEKGCLCLVSRLVSYADKFASTLCGKFLEVDPSWLLYVLYYCIFVLLYVFQIFIKPILLLFRIVYKQCIWKFFEAIWVGIRGWSFCLLFKQVASILCRHLHVFNYKNLWIVIKICWIWNFPERTVKWQGDAGHKNME